MFPISEVLSTKRKFEWTPAAQEAFENIKRLLTSTPVLVSPDFSKNVFLHCDASDYGIGVFLVQLDDSREEKPVGVCVW